MSKNVNVKNARGLSFNGPIKYQKTEVHQEGEHRELPVSVDAPAASSNIPNSNSEDKYVHFNPGRTTISADIEGISYDFNYGVRVTVPHGNYRVKFLDMDSCLTVYDAPADGVMCFSKKKYYTNWRIEVWKNGKIIWGHNLDLAGKKVLIHFPSGSLGDVLAWFPYAEQFRQKHKCELYCTMERDIAGVLVKSYPEIHFVSYDFKPNNLYATYYLGVFFPVDDRMHQPSDFRMRGIYHNAAVILGLDNMSETPYPGVKIIPENTERLIKEPYVCIAIQASHQAKYWNNLNGWMYVIKQLKEKGYRIICIDDDEVRSGGSGRFNIIPYGTENYTGKRPLQERINLLYNAEFYIGVANDYSWLAYNVGTPTVLISGYSLPFNEFPTPYRVICYHTCNGCWNDNSVVFEHDDFDWCPHHKGSEDQFNCTRYIMGGAVMKVIGRLLKDAQGKKEKIKKQTNKHDQVKEVEQ